MGRLDDKEIGNRLGEMIVELVDLIAEIDGISREEVLEILFTEWWIRVVERGGREDEKLAP